MRCSHINLVYDLPHELLITLQPKISPESTSLIVDEATELSSNKGHEEAQERRDQVLGLAGCGLCGISFQNPADQRRHAKSDWHGYNLKLKLRNLQPVEEADFEMLVEDLNESISGSESSISDAEEIGIVADSTLTALLKKQAKIHDEKDPETTPKKRMRRPGNPPLIWFSTPMLPSNVSLGIYKALLTSSEQHATDILDVLKRKQLKPAQNKLTQNGSSGVTLSSSMTGPNIFLCMIGGGHFAAMVVSLIPKIGKKATGVEERQAIVIAHKTFHRYTTRRKQGGSQSANDSAKGAAHSAGAGIRRYNEVALEAEVRALISEWKDMIDSSDLLFIRATGTTNKRTLFGPYDGQVLHPSNPKIRSFPFSTRRATQAELMRAFVELTRMKVSQVDETALAATAAEEARREVMASKPTLAPSKPATPIPSKEEETALLHTTQLQALIRRSKAPAVLSYILKNSLSPEFIFYPPTTQANHHAPTPLHLASSLNSPAVVLVLLTKAKSNPAVLNGEGKPPFDIAGDRATRDAFRVARFDLGEQRWPWDAAHCPPPMTKAEADSREAAELAHSEKVESERRKFEIERLATEALVNGETMTSKRMKGNPLGAIGKTGAELREQEARGLAPEMRLNLERERRARAAEERMRRMAGGIGGKGTDR